MSQWRVMVSALALLAGCGFEASSVEIEVAAADLSGPPSPDAGTSLSLPGGRPFNIHLKSSSQNPAAAGRARGDSDARPDGQAFCLAEVADGGSAAAEFRLGHRFRTADHRPARASIQVRFRLQHSMQASAEPTAKTLGTLGLQFLVLDSRKRVLARSNLIQATSDHSVGSAAEIHERNLSLLLEPRETCDILVYAKVEASADQGQEATVRLDIRSLTMTVDLQPAATPAPATAPESRPVN